MKTIQEQALELCYAIEEAGASDQLTKCSDLASKLRERIQGMESRLRDALMTIDELNQAAIDREFGGGDEGE